MITNLNMKTCLRCGQCFYSDVATTNYCSRACWDAAGRPREGSVHQPNATCEVCGKAYWVQPTRLASSRFCSNDCKQASTGQAIPKAELMRLYYAEQRSMQEIADLFGCSANKIVYWMNYYGLERRQISDAVYAKWNPDGDPFCIHEPQTLEEHQLFALAIGLYMGEGAKTQGRLLFANNHVGMHRIFLLFLERICGVDRSKVSAVINIFDDCDIEQVTMWWCEQLNLSKDQFFAPFIRTSKGTEYTKKTQYGTLSLSFVNIKLAKIVQKWCDEYYQQFS